MQSEAYKYWAFVSYSHRDQAWAEWLHRSLETYRVPRRLVGRETSTGPLPRRLFPVFRDQEELPSSPNLSGAIDQALQQSRYLIVIASPYAAVSKWVDQEIQRFRALGRADRILCLIVDGEPHADLQPGKGLLECFPPSLRTDDGIEPIAADVRAGKDRKPVARLKLLAGLLGVGLDELRRRERRRRIFQNAGATALAALATVALFGLWQGQQREKREALAQQQLHAHIETVYEKGRQELIARNQARAAVYLNEAYKLGIDTPALRFMLARAMRIVEAEKLAFQTGAPVKIIRFSPSARHVFTVGSDNLVRVWDAATGTMQFQLDYPKQARIAGPRFSRNNRFVYVFAAPFDAATGYLNVWDAESGKLLAKLQNAPSTAHTLNPFDESGSRVAHLAPDRAAEILELSSGRTLGRLPGAFSLAGFSRDGRRLLTGSVDGAVRIWNPDRLKQTIELKGLKSPVVAMDDTEDGSVIAAASKDGTIRAWQASDGAVRVLAGHPSPNPWLIFNLDGTRLFTGASDGVRVWNTDNGALVYALRYSGAVGNHFDISSNGRWLLASSTSRLSVQDIQSGAELFTLDGHFGLAGARDISDDDLHIATGGPDGRAVLWSAPHIPDFELRHAVDPLRWDKPWVPGVAALYSHDGKFIATGAADGTFKLWDARTHELLRSLAADRQSVNALEFSADDRRIVSAGETDGVKIWQVDTGRMMQSLDCGGKEVLSVALSGDGRYVAATMLAAGARVWDVGSGEIVASFEDRQVRSGNFSPDGRYLAFGIQAEAKIWDVAGRRFVWSQPLGDRNQVSRSYVAALAFSPDGQRLLVATSGRAAYVLDARDGTIEKSLDEPSASEFLTAGFDHSGKLALMGDASGVAVIWRLEDGKTWTLRGHAGKVYSATFSNDDRFVLTSSIDATARLWDAANGEMLDIVAEHESQMPQAPFHAAEFGPGDKTVLTGSIDGVVREWNLGEERRTPQQIESILHCRVPWAIDGDDLVAVSPDDAACPRR